MKRQVKIGLTLIGGILAVYIFITWAKSMHFFAAARSAYTIQFNNVAGLKTGDAVTIYGMPYGNVTSISLGEGGANVRISLDQGVTLRSDARAEIQIKEIMGGKLVALNPGSVGEPVGEDFVIPGTASMDFATAFSEFGKVFENLDTEAIDSVVRQMSRIANTFDKLSNSIDEKEVGDMFTDLGETADAMNRLLKDVEQRKLVGKMDSAMASVAELSKKADSTMETFNDIAGHIEGTTLPKSDSLITTMVSMLDQTEVMLTSVEEMLEKMKDENTAAGKMLYDDTFAATIDSTLRNLNKTLEHVRNKKLHVTMSLSGKQKVFEE